MGITVAEAGSSMLDYGWFEENVLMHKLYPDERKLLSEIFELVEYQAGDEIIRQDEPGGWLYILRSGSAAVTLRTSTRTIYLADAGEAALFGEMTFLAGGDASATVTAHGPCRVYRMDREGYCRLIVRNQPLLLNLFTYMLNHSVHVLRHMNEVHTHWP